MNKLYYSLLFILLFISCSTDINTDTFYLPTGRYEIISGYDKYGMSLGNCQGECEINKGKNDNEYKLDLSVTTNLKEIELEDAYINKDGVYWNNKIIGTAMLDDDYYLAINIDRNSYKFKPILNSSSSTGSNRCVATTLKGTQCKRKAEKGSIYCWQHKYNH